MDDRGRKCRYADSDVFCTVGSRRAVLNPFPLAADDCFVLSNIKRSIPRGHFEHAAEYKGVLIEIGRLARLTPSAGAFHASNAQLGSSRAEPTDEFVDNLGSVP